MESGKAERGETHTRIDTKFLRNFRMKNVRIKCKNAGFTDTVRIGQYIVTKSAQLRQERLQNSEDALERQVAELEETVNNMQNLQEFTDFDSS